MYQFMLFKSYSIMVIIFILFIYYINRIDSETLSSQTWTNLIQDLSIKIHEYKSNEKIIESHPLNEGFMLLTEDPKKSPIKITTTTLKPIHSSINNRIFHSRNISSTTCKTITIIQTKKYPSTRINRLGRKLLNEPSYDIDIDLSSIKTSIKNDYDNDFDQFLKIDDDQLSRKLFKRAVITYDGSGETTEETTEQTSQTTVTSHVPSISSTTTTTTTTTPNEYPTLSNITTIIFDMNCTNAKNTLNKIFEEFNETYRHNYDTSPTIAELEFNCDDNNTRINITLNFLTDDNITTLNDLFDKLERIATKNGVNLYSDNKCGNGIVSVLNVTPCYLIDMCHLCGTNPIRGVCYPQYNVSKCRCFAEENGLSRIYTGDFCSTVEPEPIKTPSNSTSWIPIVVGILSALAGLILMIACCLCVVCFWGGRHHHNYDLKVSRLWHLPRAQIPILGTNPNDQSNLNNTISTISSRATDSDYDPNNTLDSTFFKDLDKKMGENLRATITRPNTKSLLASLPSDTLSTLSTTYDPIDELDSIIDNEDIDLTFHDPLNELFEDEILEIENPNINIPRPKVDSKPTGLFSYF